MTTPSDSQWTEGYAYSDITQNTMFYNNFKGFCSVQPSENDIDLTLQN